MFPSNSNLSESLMGKSIVSAAKYQELSRVLSSTRAHKPKQTQLRFPNSVPTPPSAKSGAIQLQSHPSPLRMESRTPLSDVVADCTKRWFQETLKESKAGDSSMQLIVGQMYNCGYGVPRDPRKVRIWNWILLANLLVSSISYSILLYVISESSERKLS